MEDDGNPRKEEYFEDSDIVTDVIVETSYEEEEEDEGENEDEVDVPTQPVTVMVEEDENVTDIDMIVQERGELLNDNVALSRATSGRLGSGKFLDKVTILSLLLESESSMKSAPPGPKVGKTFLLDDNINFYRGRRRTGKTSFRVDEYDKWENVSLKRHYYFYQNEEFKYVDFLNGEYLLHTPSPGSKGSKKPMAVQPSLDEILVMRKLYGTIPGVIKRRVCYIERLPKGVVPKQHNLILVEYYEVPSETPSAKRLKMEMNTKENLIFDEATLQAENLSGENAENQLEGYSQMIDLDSAVLEEVKGHEEVRASEKNRGMFFSLDESIDLLLNAQTTLEEIPQGFKENEYFIVSNEENHQRELQGKRRMYIDDCGVWKNVSMKTHRYVKVDDTYAYVEYSSGQYKISNSQLRDRCDPLTESDIFLIRRVYGSLKRDEEYKRRISWIATFPKGIVPRQQHIALVEYIGRYPQQEEPHGNLKKKCDAVPYVRTPLSVMNKMKELLAHKTVKEVMAEFPDVTMSPRGLKQLQNLRYRSNYRIGPGSARDESHNNEMREMLAMVQVNGFVQHVTYIKYQAPVVIGYTVQQVNSWKYHCQERSGLNRVLGVDRTINVGPVCLTILTYPHPNLLNRKTGEQAIMVGPVLFHVDKSWHAFSTLFNHMKMCLTTVENADVDHVSIACPSEEEASITQALKLSFPKSSATLCPEHLKRDLRAFLLCELSLSTDSADKIIKDIFSGLMACAEEYDFDMKLLQLQSDYDATFPQFSNYFCKLGENIRHSLWRPTTERRPFLQWSPDNCQALDNLLNGARTWDKMTLPELILKLQEIVQQQEHGEIHAIYDEGSYKLAPHAKKYHLPKLEYMKKTSKQKNRAAENVRKFRPGVSKAAIPLAVKEELENDWEDPGFY